MEEFKVVSLIDFLAKSKLSSDVAVLVNVFGVLEDGTPVTVRLPDDLLNKIVALVSERITMPGVVATFDRIDTDDEG